MGSATISMASTVYVGLAVTSHTATALTTATLTNVAVTASSGATSSGTSGGTGGTVSPSTLSFIPSTDNATDVTSYTLDIFAAGANPSTAQPAATQNLGKPSILNNLISLDVTTTVASLASGSYFATVTAVGPGGSTRSAASPTFSH